MKGQNGRRRLGSRRLAGRFVAAALCLLSLTALLSVPVTAAEQATGKVVVPDNTGDAFELYSGSYALLLGVWDYRDIGRLSQIPSELDSVADALEAHGFEVTLAYPENKRELKLIADDFIDKYGHNQKNRILFFYSGHGFSHKDKGYLLMKDAPPVVLDSEQGPLSEDFHRTALTMNQVMTWATDMQAKHAMFMFDSCFAGTIFGTRTTSQPLSAVDFNVDAVDHQARLFITAGSATEEVPAKSDFVPAFVETISKQGTEADINRDGYVTGDEIGLYIKDSIQRLGRQTPQVGKYPPQYSKGDIVFEITPWQPENPPSIHFSIDGVELSIRGEVRSRLEKEQILSAAEQAFGIENIRFDSLKATRDVGRASWVDGVIQSISGLRYLERGEMSVTDEKLSVEGVVNHDNKKARLIASLSNDPALAQLSLTEQIAVVPMKTAELHYKVNDGTVVVAGALQESREKNQIINAVRRSFGEDIAVTDAIQVGEDTVSANWIAAVIEANQVLNSISQGEFRIDNEKVSVSGGIGSSENLALLKYVLEQNFPKHAIDIQMQIEVGQDPELRFQFDNGAVAVSGTLSSKSETSMVATNAINVFGGDNVEFNIDESPDYEQSDWLQATSSVLPALASLVSGSLSVRGDLVDIEGVVNASEDRQLIIDSLRTHLASDFRVRENIEIKSVAAVRDEVQRVASEFRCEFDEGKVVLSGRLPDGEAIDRVVKSAKAVFGDDSVDNRLVVDENATSAAGWIDKVGNVLRFLVAIESGTLTVNETSSTLVGVVRNEDDWRLVRISMQTLSHGEVNTESIVVAPAPEQSADSITAGVATKKSGTADGQQQDMAGNGEKTRDYCAVFRPDRHVVKRHRVRARAGYRVRGQPHARCDSWLGLTPDARVTVTAQYGNWSYIVVADAGLKGWVFKDAFEKEGFFKRIFGGDTR